MTRGRGDARRGALATAYASVDDLRPGRLRSAAPHPRMSRPPASPPSATIAVTVARAEGGRMFARGHNTERFNEGLVRLSRELENLARRNLTD